MTSLAAHAIYGAAWLSFAFGHSLLAGGSVKRRLQSWLGAGYRLAYNVLAGLHLTLLVVLGAVLFGTELDFDRPWLLVGCQWLLVVAGITVMSAGMVTYDLGRFIGISQWRTARAGGALAEDEPLRLEGPHRWVRHPVYAGAHLFMWGGAINELGLTTAVWVSLYLLVGMMLEERRLIALYGEAYRVYRAAVPALIPWKGRVTL